MNPARRVLLVDDETEVLEWLSLEMRMRGWEIATATSGKQALDRAAEAVPDLVVLDHHMPGMTGLEAARALRQRGMSPAIVLFSAALPAATGELVQLGVLPVSKVDVNAFFRLVDTFDSPSATAG